MGVEVSIKTLRMPAHEMKSCSRCGREFECKLNNITQCQCYEVELSKADRAMIGLVYADCLCRSCLLQIKNDSHYLSSRQDWESFE